MVWPQYLLANDREKGHCLLLPHYVEYIAAVFLLLVTHFNNEKKALVAKERQYRSLSVQLWLLYSMLLLLPFIHLLWNLTDGHEPE